MSVLVIVLKTVIGLIAAIGLLMIWIEHGRKP